MMLKLQYFLFFLQRKRVNKKDGEGVNFMLGSWQGVNGSKKIENPCLKRCRPLYNHILRHPKAFQQYVWGRVTVGSNLNSVIPKVNTKYHDVCCKLSLPVRRVTTNKQSHSEYGVRVAPEMSRVNTPRLCTCFGLCLQLMFSERSCMSSIDPCQI